MTFIRNLKIGTRLAIGFGAMIALMAAMALIGITRVQAVDDNTQVIVNDRYVKIGHRGHQCDHGAEADGESSSNLQVPDECHGVSASR